MRWRQEPTGWLIYQPYTISGRTPLATFIRSSLDRTVVEVKTVYVDVNFHTWENAEGEVIAYLAPAPARRNERGNIPYSTQLPTHRQ